MVVNKVTVTMNTGVYEAEGATVHEALDALNLDYTKIKTKGVITLERRDKKSSKLFYLQPLRRLVSNRLRKAQVARDLEYLLK